MGIDLECGVTIPILYEDRSVLAIDKPEHWMLAPDHWVNTSRNLLPALMDSIRAGEFWARSRGLRFLRYVHRLDAETTGVLLLVKSEGAVAPYSRLFDSREMSKLYLAVVDGVPKLKEWVCDLPLQSGPDRTVVSEEGKPSRTCFKVVRSVDGRTLIEARPVTGRTHQIRVHLKSAGVPVCGDVLYGARSGMVSMALRAVRLEYQDPFLRRKVVITAQAKSFLSSNGF